ncbi:4-hydroxy-tetrahydrodipicolinate reductase [Flocculibacter collagenilyticus]|uniref:4-hydroxy-tetrahydrodipicolinate reductase n=1 Tax=Flocculibacter collagenilyticus TaxID=2744479 RepID=UPI0018F6B29F|nr:4-hydroxy-tetrahydrodipicolinate reductase [Flocculibacter collagenilyticus]
MTDIGIFGANGRMGRALIEAIQNDDNVTLARALVRESSQWVGMDVGEVIGMGRQGLAISDNHQALGRDCDVMIDFSLAEGMLAHLALCVEHKLPMVIGTTGLSEAQLLQLDDAAKSIPIVFAANFSVGVNVMLSLLQQTAKVMGDEVDIEIWEAHHRFKRDAPSGTAMKMGQVIADTLERDLKQHAIYGREGDTGPRDAKSIGFATLRAGDIVGEHTALFADLGERLEITHKASSRLTFAKGAIRAAAWLKDKQAGLYDMQNVLGLG